MIVDYDTDAARAVDAKGFKSQMHGLPFCAISFSYLAYFKESEVCLRYILQKLTNDQPNEIHLIATP